MSFFGKIRRLEINSGAARAVLGLCYRKGSVYSIPFGPLSGLKMHYDPTINFHDILGLRDKAVFGLLDRMLFQSQLVKPDAVICEGGANVGVYTMYLSR